MAPARYSAQRVLDQLRDFQLATTEHAFRRLYLDDDSTRRFLVADETGLGKTFVAKGVIAKTIEHLQDDDTIKRIDIVYVCSNGDIADQNLRKLVVVGDHRATPSTRLTMLVTHRDLLSPQNSEGKPVTFVSFTPATSFDFGWQTGKASERALLFLLLADHLDLGRGEKTAFKRLLQGNVSSIDSFDGYVDRLSELTELDWEPSIHRSFLRAFDRSRVRRDLLQLIDDTRGRSSLTADLGVRAREWTAAARQMLAHSSVEALEPDLVILDEFQRFKRLLEPDNDAGALAGELFSQRDARVLLTSATPYKPFTYAEEGDAGDNHYSDFIATLEFLAGSAAAVVPVRDDLQAFRRAALSGDRVDQVREQLEGRLRKLLCRTERPSERSSQTKVLPVAGAREVAPEDLAGYVWLDRVAQAVDAPMTVEYWKSSPYFANFFDGYKIGEKVKEAVKDDARRNELRPMLKNTQHLRRMDIRAFKTIDWGNARLRQLASDTVAQGSWQLLWIPPSCPYYASAGVFSAPEARTVTKRLVFSSWVAAPTAIASLLSYDAERRIETAVNRFENPLEGRRTFTSRLGYRVDEGRPSAMATLALFWPCPTLADATDPLRLATKAGTNSVDASDLLASLRPVVEPIVGRDGTGSMSAATTWYWAAPLLAESRTRRGVALADRGEGFLVAGLTGAEDTDEDDQPGTALAHVREALATMRGKRPEVAPPNDLVQVSSMLGLAGPGNVAWRAVGRVRVQGGETTDEGQWQAAAVIASGLRALFARPESTYLLDGLDREADDVYWIAVLRYCLAGNLQAVVDEYLHHLAEDGGHDLHTDAGLLDLAMAARRALTIRPARYVAFDPDHPSGNGIPFMSRFALRFGNIRQDSEDVRLPEIRAAFNSPFWPFVLATTSIGQEGVDFHWWCHAIVHWNLPANPVDFEQREGRINRYKGHAIRRNVASRHAAEALAGGCDDVWEAMFKLASAETSDGFGDLSPFWIYDGPARIERSILGFPLSRDQTRWEQLQDLLALYRLAYGQPRQDDMVGLLARSGVAGDPTRIDELRLDLRPPRLS